jgi:AraC-like DNA-binding protein
LTETTSEAFAKRHSSDPLRNVSRYRTDLGDLKTSVARVHRAPPGYYEHPPYDGIAVYMAMSRVVGRIDVGDGAFDMAAQARDFVVSVPGSGGKMDSFRGGHGIQVIISPEALDASTEGGSSGGWDFPRLHKSFHNDRIVSNLMLQIADLGLAAKDPDALHCDALILELVVSLHQYSKASQRRSQEAIALSSRSVAEIVDFMQAHIGEAITVEQLAQIVQLPATQFLKRFRNAVGETPYQHLMRRRLEGARLSIMSSSSPIAEIAFEYGFSSQQHLTGVFSERFGISPAAFRKQILGQEIVEQRSEKMA